MIHSAAAAGSSCSGQRRSVMEAEGRTASWSLEEMQAPCQTTSYAPAQIVVVEDNSSGRTGLAGLAELHSSRQLFEARCRGEERLTRIVIGHGDVPNQQMN